MLSLNLILEKQAGNMDTNMKVMLIIYLIVS